MRSRPDDTALRDIPHDIELAARFSTGFDADAFRRDLKTVYAVARGLRSFPKLRAAWRTI
jgi:uncharacterized protein with HEPN domain